MIKAVVTDEGQITIPATIRAKLGILPGTVLLFDEEASSLHAEKEIDLEQIRATLGCAKDALPGFTSKTWLNETRGRSQAVIHERLPAALTRSHEHYR